VANQTDLFLISYADENAFRTNAGALQDSLPQLIASGFSAGGFAMMADTPTDIPEPPSWSIVVLSLLLPPFVTRRPRARGAGRAAR
jgi:hypothetical protein